MDAFGTGALQFQAARTCRHTCPSASNVETRHGAVWKRLEYQPSRLHHWFTQLLLRNHPRSGFLLSEPCYSHGGLLKRTLWCEPFDRWYSGE